MPASTTHAGADSVHQSDGADRHQEQRGRPDNRPVRRLRQVVVCGSGSFLILPEYFAPGSLALVGLSRSMNLTSIISVVTNTAAPMSPATITCTGVRLARSAWSRACLRTPINAQNTAETPQAAVPFAGFPGCWFTTAVASAAVGAAPSDLEEGVGKRTPYSHSAADPVRSRTAPASAASRCRCKLLLREAEALDLLHVLRRHLRSVARDRLADNRLVRAVAHFVHHLHQLPGMHLHAALQRPELPRQVAACWRRTRRSPAGSRRPGCWRTSSASRGRRCR